jgi:predicted GNAT family acetyltransferase
MDRAFAAATLLVASLFSWLLAETAVRPGWRRGAGSDLPGPVARYDPEMGPVITDAEAAQRYEARSESDLAGFIDYAVKRDRIALIHTEVLPAYRGQGIAEELVRFALDDARRRGLRVIATCPYVRSYVQRHPETHDIVVGMAPA